MYNAMQGDIIWVNFTPSVRKEMRGKHPSLVVSSNEYNRKTNYALVCPITSKGNEFSEYIPLKGYNKIFGRVNATQIYSINTSRIQSSKYVEKIKDKDFLMVKQVIDYALKLDF